MPEIFGGRTVIRDKTIELVAKSSLVVSHASTSVSFAVLFDKPIMFVKMAEMDASALVDAMAASLGLRALDINDIEAANMLSFDVSNWKGTKYEEYKYRHLKSRSAAELMVWEIVAEHLKGLKA